MKNIKLFLFFIVLILPLLITNSSLAASRGIRVISKQGQNLYLYKDYHAIVIGISNYEKWPKLPNAVNDAKEVAIKLKQIGFDVQLVVNPTSSELKYTFNDIARRLGAEKNRALLLYFAGHGETTTLADGSQLGFIVPKDCPLQNLDPLGFDKKAVSMKEIEMLALRVKSIHMLMLFDSCFSGSLFSMKRAAPVDVSEKSAKPVRQFITAGTAEEPVPDKSVFKICFLQGLDGYADYNKDSYITGSELGMYLQTKVINYSRGAQHPQYGKINNPLLDKGDFIFAVVGDAKDKAKSLGEEPPKLAYIPKTVTAPRISLRKEPTELSQLALKRMLMKYRFYDSERHPYGDFENDFSDNGNGTITDRATGLIWQKKGSEKLLSRREATRYVKELNKEKFGGHGEWRIPTIEELASLIDSTQTQELYIDPVFDRIQKKCWSADSLPQGSHLGGTATIHYTQSEWIINFSKGYITYARWANKKGPWGIRSKDESNYVRAVRSLK